MNPEWYLAWYNLIFVAPFVAALLYLVAYAVSGITFGDTEAEASGHVEGEAHAEADAHADAHADHDAGDHDAAEHEAAEHEAGHSQVHPSGSRGPALSGIDVPLYRRVLQFVGVGRAPLSILLMWFFFIWGFVGVGTNALLRDIPFLGELPWLVSVPVAALGSLFVTRELGRALGRWMPSAETYVEDRSALVGRVGEAMFPIDQHFGMAVVRDLRGNSHQVQCRTYADAGAIPKGAPVLLVDYDAGGRFYRVIVSDIKI